MPKVNLNINAVNTLNQSDTPNISNDPYDIGNGFDIKSITHSDIKKQSIFSGRLVKNEQSDGFGIFSVRNWPVGFKTCIKNTAESLARQLTGTQIENRKTGHIVDQNQEGTQRTCSEDKYSIGNQSFRHSSEKFGESKGLLRSLTSSSGAIKLLTFLQTLNLASAQGTTTIAPTTTTAQALSNVISFDTAVFAQAVKESTELVAFLNVAFHDALTEAQQTNKNKMLVGGTAAVGFLGCWIGIGTLFGHILSQQLAPGNKTDLLIKSIEGATKLWAAYKLHQLIEMSEELRGQLEVDGERIVVSEDPEASREQNITNDGVRKRNDISQSESANADLGRVTALEKKYKERFEKNSASLYGNLANVVKYVATQAVREGGELGVLSGVIMAPYLIAGANIGAAVTTVALSGATGVSIPIAAYYSSKGIIGLISHIEKKFRDTDLLTRKVEGFSNAVGKWTKGMLVFALASYAVHEFEEVFGIDVKLWDLTKSYSWLSEKEMPFAAISALLPYDANPTFWQMIIITCGWTMYAAYPCAKFAAKQLNHIYHKNIGDCSAVESAAPSLQLQPHDNDAVTI